MVTKRKYTSPVLEVRGSVRALTAEVKDSPIIDPGAGGAKDQDVSFTGKAET